MSKLEDILKLGREYGVLKLKAEGFEIEFAPWALVPDGKGTVPIGDQDKMPTEEQFQMWSTGEDLEQGIKSEPPE